MMVVMEQTLWPDSDGFNQSSSTASLVSGPNTLTSLLLRVMYSTTLKTEEVDHAHREPQPGTRYQAHRQV